MKRVTRLAPLVLVLMMLSLNVADVRAGQELNLTLVSLEEVIRRGTAQRRLRAQGVEPTSEVTRRAQSPVWSF